MLGLTLEIVTLPHRQRHLAQRYVVQEAITKNTYEIPGSYPEALYHKFSLIQLR